jgi:hypothetical protein
LLATVVAYAAAAKPTAQQRVVVVDAAPTHVAALPRRTLAARASPVALLQRFLN